MLAPSIIGFRALPPVMAVIAIAALLVPAAHALDAKPAHFALYYPTVDSARVIPLGPFPQTVAIKGTPENARFFGSPIPESATATA